MRIIILLFALLCAGCTNSENIKLNDIKVKFDSFDETDSLSFVSFYSGIIEEPSEMLLNGDHLIINDLNYANDDYISIFSLKSNEVTRIQKGSGPNEMKSCKISILENDLWLYDMSSLCIENTPIEKLLDESFNLVGYDLSKYYYDASMLNDTIMVGTNDLSVDKKISFVNIKNGNVVYAGDYSYLNKNIALGVLIDACSCYININPKSKAISLAYRYTDVVEIYNSDGLLKYSLHGPKAFDVELEVRGSQARKNNDTRKAFVNTYATENYIYLLYSGCTHEEKNWSYGTEIYVYSWQGKPVKRYNLSEPIYAFAVDEENGCIYSYSLQTSELTKAII